MPIANTWDKLSISLNKLSYQKKNSHISDLYLFHISNYFLITWENWNIFLLLKKNGRSKHSYDFFNGQFHIQCLNHIGHNINRLTQIYRWKQRHKKNKRRSMVETGKTTPMIFDYQTYNVFTFYHGCQMKACEECRIRIEIISWYLARFFMCCFVFFHVFSNRTKTNFFSRLNPPGQGYHLLST